MAWPATGPTGNLHFSDEGALPQVPPATGSMSGGNGWSGLSLDAPFSLDVTGQGLVAEIEPYFATTFPSSSVESKATIKVNDGQYLLLPVVVVPLAVTLNSIRI